MISLLQTLAPQNPISCRPTQTSIGKVNVPDLLMNSSKPPLTRHSIYDPIIQFVIRGALFSPTIATRIHLIEHAV
jgi:hypothetical protein